MNRIWTHRRLFGAAFVVGAGATSVYLYKSPSRKHHFTRSTSEPAWWRTIHPETFEVSTLAYEGQWPSSKHILRSEEECENLIKSGESKVEVGRPGDMVVRWEINQLGSNKPCEDSFAVDLIDKGSLDILREGEEGFWHKWGEVRKSWMKADAAKKDGDEMLGGDDVLLLTVLDGHGVEKGWEGSNILKKTLHGCIAYGLSKLPREHSAHLQADSEETERQTKDEGSTVKMLKETFIAVDDDLQNGVIALLNPAQATAQSDPKLPYPSPSQVAMSLVESPGSCAITAMIDIKNEKLYVANLGDCRAVAGWYDPEGDMWRCDILSSDLMAENPKEVERMVGEHPESEKDDVIFEGKSSNRTLGSLMVTRAFGDAYYKRQKSDSDRLREAFDIRYPALKREVLTPPCISDLPDATVRDLRPATGEQLRFLILASDGLWDNLSSEEAALLTAFHLEKDQSSPISKTVLPTLQHFTSPPEVRPYPAGPLPGTPGLPADGHWVFEDENASTHLLRNALGRGDAKLRRKILSMKDGTLRRFRDDITVIVVSFDAQKPVSWQ